MHSLVGQSEQNSKPSWWCSSNSDEQLKSLFVQIFNLSWKKKAFLFLSSPSSCPNWVSCSCYSTDVSFTKSCSFILWIFIHHALEANSDFIINSITQHQAPQIEAALQRKKSSKESLLFSRARSSTFSCRFHRFGNSTPLNKTKVLHFQNRVFHTAPPVALQDFCPML